MSENENAINIAIAGGPCTGKSTLAATLTYRLKMDGTDYESIGDRYRMLKGEFGAIEHPAERLYLWMQQEKEELRSSARDGFVTDSPLFHLYISARLYERTKKDRMIVGELWERSLDATGRYGIIAMASDPSEFPYKLDSVRRTDEETAARRHLMTRSYLEHYFPERVIFVSGAPEDRSDQVMARRGELGK